MHPCLSTVPRTACVEQLLIKLRCPEGQFTGSSPCSENPEVFPPLAPLARLTLDRHSSSRYGLFIALLRV